MNSLLARRYRVRSIGLALTLNMRFTGTAF